MLLRSKKSLSGVPASDLFYHLLCNCDVRLVLGIGIVLWRFCKLLGDDETVEWELGVRGGGTGGSREC